MIQLTHQPQLFLDDHLVARSDGIRREIQTPIKYPDNPLIVQEHPWERQSVQCYGNVLYDTDTSLFRMWYFAAEERDPDDVPWLVKEGDAKGKAKRLYRTCYAESEDGVRWTKPTVTAVDTPLHDEHNILIEDIHSICVLDEPDDPDPARRYKAGGGKTLALSEDGLHWQTSTWEAVGKNDTGTSVVHWQGRYLAYVRQQESHPPDWPLVRAVGLTESGDFIDWTPKRTILQTDEADGYPWTQPYGMTVFPCGDVLVGLLWMIVLDHVEEADNPWKWNNRVGDVRTELVVSRDGLAWQRVADRAPFLEPGPGSWDKARAYPGTSVLQHDDKLWFYYSGTRHRHGEGAGRTGIGLATLPADRLVAVVADRDGDPGFLETPPLRMPHGNLVVNADLSDGSLQVELADASGHVLPGFDQTACTLTPVEDVRPQGMGRNAGQPSVDNLRSPVTWGDAVPASVPRDEPVVLRFTLQGTRLFSFQISA